MMLQYSRTSWRAWWKANLSARGLKVFKQSEMGWEAPGTVHVVSRNASKIEQAKLLVFFVGEEGKALTVTLC